MPKFALLFLFLLLAGCAVQQQENNHLADSLHTQTPQSVLEKLKKTDPKSQDLAQFHLNIGLLQLMSGEFKPAIATLTLAKREMAALEASSVSENIAAGTINELFRSYSGYPTDRVMVHNMLALSYLFAHNIEDARVEMLQADVAMKKLATAEGLNGQLATTHLLAGIIYELLDEQSNALISYRHAADIIKQRGMKLPLGLKQSLLRMSFKLGAKPQYLAYRKQFPELPRPSPADKNQIFLLYFDGVISHKKQNSIMVPDHHNKQWIRISMPAYPQYAQPSNHAEVSAGKTLLTTEVVDNLELSVRDDLKKEYPSILLLTTTRAIAKHQLVKKAEKQDSLLGSLVNLATILTEEADLRSWNMLPSNIQFAYLESGADNVLIDSCKTSSAPVMIAKGSKNVFLVNSLSNKIFRYQE